MKRVIFGVLAIVKWSCIGMFSLVALWLVISIINVSLSNGLKDPNNPHYILINHGPDALKRYWAEKDAVSQPASTSDRIVEMELSDEHLAESATE